MRDVLHSSQCFFVFSLVPFECVGPGLWFWYLCVNVAVATVAAADVLFADYDDDDVLFSELISLSRRYGDHGTKNGKYIRNVRAENEHMSWICQSIPNKGPAQTKLYQPNEVLMHAY